jgi:hypothetical protein
VGSASRAGTPRRSGRANGRNRINFGRPGDRAVRGTGGLWRRAGGPRLGRLPRRTRHRCYLPMDTEISMRWQAVLVRTRRHRYRRRKRRRLRTNRVSLGLFRRLPTLGRMYGS